MTGIFTFSLAFYSDEASRHQARSILYLLVRFKRQARIGLRVIIAGVRFLRFRRHFGLGLQVSATFIDERAQVYRGHWDDRPGRYDLLCGDFHFTSHFGVVHLPCKGMSHHDLVWDMYPLLTILGSLANRKT